MKKEIDLKVVTLILSLISIVLSLDTILRQGLI
ncbi:Uncharacterised protein [Clostridium perfringens]|uniref:Uncharacterized protein n=1 Tax=Clostridium perfringens TaxID=1502 RepID=A0A2X3IMN4_CLOPF|nr:Uncharacterised protein [Clostridium perfringens]